MRTRIWLPLALALLFAAPAGAPAREPDLAAGDLDGDGFLTARDLRMLGRDLNTLAAAYRGDVDGDGRVSPDDLTALATALLRAAEPGAEAPSPEDVRAFIDLALGLPDGSPPPDRGGRNRRRLSAVEKARVPVKPGAAGERPGPAARGPAPGAGPRPDDRGVKPLPGSRGRDAAFSPDAARFDALLQRFTGPGRVECDFAKIRERRHRLLGVDPGSRTIGEIFGLLENRTLAGRSGLSDIPVADAPDVTVYAAERDAPRRTSGAEGAGRRGFLPRSRYRLKHDLADPRGLRYVETATGRGGSVAAEYARVSAPAGVPVAPAALDEAVRTLSPDPLVSQLLADALSPARVIEAADVDRDRKLTRSEFFTWLFKPSTAWLVLNGRAAEAGIREGSRFATRYREIAVAAIPGLAREGALSPAAASASLAFVRRPPGGLIAGANAFLFQNEGMRPRVRLPETTARSGGTLSPSGDVAGGNPAVAAAMKKGVADFLKSCGFPMPEDGVITDEVMKGWIDSGIDMRGPMAMDLLDAVAANLPPGTDMGQLSEALAGESETAKLLMRLTVADAVKEAITDPKVAERNPELAADLQRYVEENGDTELSRLVQAEKEYEEPIYAAEGSAEVSAGGGGAVAAPPEVPPEPAATPADGAPAF